MKYLFSFLFSLILTACSGGHNPDKVPLENPQKVGASGYVEIEPGRWRMTEALKDVSAGANFELSFSLADEGSITLHAFANSNLYEGVDIQFLRQGNSLSVSASVRGNIQAWSSYFTGVDAREPLTFTLDIHNNERPAHILIWKGSKNPSLNHRNTLYNTAEDSVDLGYAGAPGNGSHRAWGVSFKNAEINNALVSSPQETHE